jgi:hypothetical protein
MSVKAGHFQLPSVAPDPDPRHNEDGRVTDKVEQIIDPATGIIGRPLAQLGLDPQYLRLGPRRGGWEQP